jgi:Uncharacterized protein involved in propionate catabolism
MLEKLLFNGVLSAFLAKNGFAGSGSILDGEEGFLKTMVYSNFGKDYTLEDALSNVGNVELREIYFKKLSIL